MLRRKTSGYPNGEDGPPAAPAAGKVCKGEPTEKAKELWEKDIIVLQESVKLMLNNHVAEADKLLEDSGKEVAQREFNFAEGEHDSRGAFAFVHGIMGMIHGLASLQKDQLDAVAVRLKSAEDLILVDGEWAGKAVLRGLCLVMSGMVQIMQGSYPAGVWKILRSWQFLRNLETEGLCFEGHERSVVRSTALFALGVFNLCASMLPPAAMKGAAWLTGFKGGRETAVEQLRLCWEEGGIQAPFAGLCVCGVAVDLSSYLGEFGEERENKRKLARKILDWSDTAYPGAFFFEGLKATYLSEVKDVDGAISKLKEMEDVVKNLPAFLMIVKIRLGQYYSINFEWLKAAVAFKEALEVHRQVNRRAFCPALGLIIYLCSLKAGDEGTMDEAVAIIMSYKQEKKKWSWIDTAAMEHAEAIIRAKKKDIKTEDSEAGSPRSEVSAGSETAAKARPRLGSRKEAKEPWYHRRPSLGLYVRICAVYRGVSFMKPEQVEQFMEMIREEIKDCTNDVESKSVGLFLQAESMRQVENWDEALRIGAECVALWPELSKEERKTGAVHFSQLVSAYAQHAKGKPGAAKDALTKLDSFGNNHTFYKEVEFKATHLRQLIGMEFQDNYIEMKIVARNKGRIVVEVPDEVGAVEWDWVLTDLTLSFEARFTKEGESESEVVQSVDKHPAEDGPFVGSFETNKPGTLELIFDNTFSRMRAKNLQCRLKPNDLVAVKEEKI